MKTNRLVAMVITTVVFFTMIGSSAVSACSWIDVNQTYSTALVKTKIADVQKIQTFLNSLYTTPNCGTPDGYYGDKTATAITNFQTLNVLDIDGKSGPNTNKRLHFLYDNRTKLYKATSNLKVRSGPGTNYAELYTMKQGAIVVEISRNTSTGWSYVNYFYNNKGAEYGTGYVSYGYIAKI